MSEASIQIPKRPAWEQGTSYQVTPGSSVQIETLPRDNEPITFGHLPLFQYFKQVALTSETMDALLLGCGNLIAARSSCVGIWVTQKKDAEFAEVHSLRQDSDKSVWQNIEAVGTKMIKLANSSRQIQFAEIPHASNHLLIMCPVVTGSGVDLIIGGLFAPSGSQVVDSQLLLGIAAQVISNWISDKKLERLETRSKSLNDIVSITKEIDRAKNLQSASLKLVNILKRMCQANQVAFASHSKSGPAKLLAISDVEQLDPASATTKVTSQACGQSIRLGKVLYYPDATGELSPSELFPLERYCKSNGVDACISLPMQTESGLKVGSMLLAVSQTQIVKNGYVEYVQQLLSMLTGHLDVVLRANLSIVETLSQRFKTFFVGKIARIAMITAAIAVLVMFIPVPYRIGCDCEIQPVLRRYIAAPHQGILANNLVENGEVVEEGQIVAILEGRQLRIEFAGLEAEITGARKKRDSALARGEVAAAQIAFSELKQLESKMQLIQQKLANLEIRSPISGIIVAGDLEKAEGAPVEMGQTLFEVGPLDKMLAEIAIPESEIPYVEPGMPIAIKLNAYPFKTWQGTIEKIHSKSEVINQDSVFVAEVQIENTDQKLKPGMKGSAKIGSRVYPLGWNLFHHATEKIRYWMIW